MNNYDYNITNKSIPVKDLKAGLEGKYELPCGHNNGVIPGVWPFDTMICVDCKARTQFVHKIAQDKEVKK